MGFVWIKPIKLSQTVTDYKNLMKNSFDNDGGN